MCVWGGAVPTTDTRARADAPRYTNCAIKSCSVMPLGSSVSTTKAPVHDGTIMLFASQLKTLVDKEQRKINDNDNVIAINSIFVPLSLALGSNREIGRSHIVIQTTRTSDIVVHWRCVRFFVIACITDSRQTRQPTDYL